MKMIIVAGARPNFMKIAPLVHQLRKCGADITWKLVHTGQHYDYEMSRVFFDDLELPEPDFFLDAGSGTHAEQTARVILEFEKVCIQEKPDWVVVVGDVNSTMACSITAKKMNIQVAHVEAGLRSRDMSMPEEINRMLTDAIADYLFVTEKSGVDNLKREGRKDGDIFFVGNVMIDTLLYHLDQIKKNPEPEENPAAGKIKAPSFAVVTLHRPSNVDDRNTLAGILKALVRISADMPVIFPVHPRTKKNIEVFNLEKIVNDSNVQLLPPMPYIEFLSLWKDACLVLTDSGGLQEETTALGIPCFTIRENTERPVTIEEGTNRLVGTTGEGILSAYEQLKTRGPQKGKVPKHWDGKAAGRILNVLITKKSTADLGI
ncbi:MAG: UDP-N-acetylglucosamine 2-epimerase (non-hydrolyzing) [Deltaproteobacteria bacterium]|nr:UDP-N-acetylglucosamine 2-epimerase (non-hydrolyzing) [Deltaproteobacteria bacterium]